MSLAPRAERVVLSAPYIYIGVCAQRRELLNGICGGLLRGHHKVEYLPMTA